MTGMQSKTIRPRRYAIALLVLAALLLVSISIRAEDMGFLSKVMFSEVQGVLLKDGKPIQNAKITRKHNWHWKSGEESDEAITDASGRFHFPVIRRTGVLASLLPHEPVVSQNITVVVDGKEYALWQFFKHDYDINGELSGKPIKLTCDLMTKPDYHVVGTKVYGICMLQD